MSSRSTLRRLRGLARRILRPFRASDATSSGYEILSGAPDATHDRDEAWHAAEVAERQDAAWRPLLEEMRAGRPRRDLLAAAEAYRATDLRGGSLLDVGCGSGYYSEILTHLLGHPLRYSGIDFSHAMVALARRSYPEIRV